MDKLTNYAEIKDFFRSVDTPIIGIGVDAFSRLGIESFTPGFSIVCLVNTKELIQIAKDVAVTCIELSDPEFVAGVKKNSSVLLQHPEVTRLLSAAAAKGGVAYTYKVIPEVETALKATGVAIAARPAAAGDLLEDKINFRRIVTRLGIETYKTAEYAGSELTYEKLKQDFTGKTVLQFRASSGGLGTFFVSSEQDFKAAMAGINSYVSEREKQVSTQADILAADFVTGISASVTAVATRWGVFVTNIQNQLIGIPEAVSDPAANAGQFCGHDWSASRFTAAENQKAVELTSKFGEYAYKELGYRGIFGLDLLITPEGNVFPIECNPRLTGVLPVLDLIQDKASHTPVIALHLLEFLADRHAFELDYQSISQELSGQKNGSHLFLMAKGDQNLYSLELEPGVYSFTDNELKRIRDGYTLAHLKSAAEFIITEVQRQPVAPGKRLCRIISQSAISADSSTLTNETRQLISAIYAHQHAAV